MPWYRLRSGVLWFGRSAPAGAVPTPAPAPGMPIQDAVDVAVEDFDEPPMVGASVKTGVATDAEEPVEVVPRVVGGSGLDELDGAESVTELMSLTLTGLHDYARKIGINVPARARKAEIVSLIHNAENRG